MTHSSIDLWQILATAVGTVIVFAGLSVWGRRRGVALLQAWAGQQGLVLVSASRRSFVPHWPLESGKGYQFFRILARDKSDALRRGWVRCSDFTYRDPTKVEVIWDTANAGRTR